jgi:exosortase
MDDMMSSVHTAQERRPAWYALPFLAALIMIWALYWTTFAWWWTEWTMPGSFYAHALFVPFFVGVMVYRNRERLAAARWQPSWIGLVPLVLSMALLMLAQRSEVTTVKSLSFILLLLGTSLLILGTAWTRILLFPLLFIVMMMPLVPDQLINSIAFPIQITSARIATALLNLIPTLHAAREGTMIQMENYKMAVELPCSGFKTLVSLLTFSAAFAYLVEAATWKRWALFLITIPLSLIINALRIALIGLAGELISVKAAATFHDWSGVICLVLAFLFLFSFARLLRCERFLGIPLSDEEEKRDQAKREQQKSGAAEAEPGPSAPAWWQCALAWRPTDEQIRRVLPSILAMDLVLAGTLAVQASVLKPVPPKPPIATTQVPSKFVSNDVTWMAAPALMDGGYYDKLPKAIQEELNPIRVIDRDYLGSDGARLHFFMTAGNGRRVFHDPHTCALGSDAMLNDVGIVDIPTQHGIVRVQESRYKKVNNPEESEAMYCYIVEDKVVQRTEQVRNSMIWQTFFGDSGKPSYFFRVVQYAQGSDEAKRQQMINFISGMWDQIGPILKGQAPARAEPPPTPVANDAPH